MTMFRDDARARTNEVVRAAASGLALAGAVTGSLVLAWQLARRRSVAASMWQPGAGRILRAGPLGVRLLGEGEHVILLIPGLAATQSFWGAAYDRLAVNATVVVADPLGFGSSMRHGPRDTVLTATDHREAFTAALRELGLDGRPTTVVGHSMGASLALLWAAQSPDVTGVVAFDAPLYRTRAEADDRVRHLGWFEALMSKGTIAQATCAWMCEHREAGALLSTLINPELPTPVARAAIQHSWPAYIGSFTSIVTGDGWMPALENLANREVPVVLVDGASDPVPAPGRALELARRYATVQARTHSGAHHLPLTAADWCAEVIASVASSTYSRAVSP